MVKTLHSALIVGLGVAGLGVGLVAFREPVATEAEPPGDPNDAIKPATVMAVLSEDQPLRFALSESIGTPKGRGQIKFFAATQAHYEGPVDATAVATLVDRGRSEVLEHRLAPFAAQELRASMAAFDEAFRDVSVLIDETEQETKRQLRERADRQIKIATRPRERDPAYAELSAARSKLRPVEGVIWGEIDGVGERHLIVHWDEWPALHAMYDDRFYMLSERRRRVREWISSNFRSRGIELFDCDDHGGGVRSSAVAETR